MTNVGTIDRVIRLLLAAVLLYLGLALYAHSTLGLGLTIAGVVLGLSSVLGVCLLYRLLGIRTCPVKDLSQNQ